MIRVSHVQKFFNRKKSNEIHVLNDITIDFPQKGLIILTGTSGSGKTTFLNTLGGLDTIESGDIYYNDVKVKPHDHHQWDDIRTKDVGYIFQNYYLIPNLSVYDNLALVLKMLGIDQAEESKVRIEYVLKAVGMFKYRKKLASQLSGGQQQRIAIARALVKESRIIIADEPTGNLDSQNTLDIMNIIKK